MVTGGLPRNPFTAIVQDKIIVPAFSVVCFVFILLLYSATVYSVKHTDLHLNRFRPTTIQAIIHDRPGEPDARNMEKPPEKAHVSPLKVLDNTENAKEMKHKDKAENLRHADKTEETEALKDANSIKKFWKQLTRAPRVVRCANTSCLSKAALQRNMTSLGLNSTTSTCPVYFQWIYEDLAPWMQHGISLDLMEKAKQFASFRVIIRNGRLFVEPYHNCFQTRSLFTIWGLLQLLEYYPGLVPDVDLMFACEDRPVVKKKAPGVPPPVFRYCSAKDFWDIPFPDWSYWGWSEINIAPWDQELSRILKCSKKTKWAARNPVAYWKGNPSVARLRQQLLNCNSSQYGAQIYAQDWIKEIKRGFKDSNLADQCDYRYKIYAEGHGWSVSLKYILACNSPSLLISPGFHDFFSRGLVPRVSYWPVRYKSMCDSIKFAVDWGNNNSAEAERIGKAGQEFMAKQVSMKHVYDYMLHILTEYAKLLRFSPKEVVAGREVCSAEILCSAQEVEKRFMEQSGITMASSVAPCRLGAYESGTIKELEKAQRLRVRQIEGWEDAVVGHAERNPSPLRASQMDASV